MSTTSKGRGPTGRVVKKPGKKRPDGTYGTRTRPWFPVVTYYDQGQRRERWLPACRLESEAKKALRAALKAMDDHQWKPRADRLTVADYLTGEWLPSLAANDRTRETTRVSYALHVRAYIVPALGKMRLDQVTGGDLAAFYGRLRTEGGQGGRVLSASTVARVHATVSRAFRDAVEAGHLAVNPARTVPTLQRPRQAKPGGSALRYWTADELRAFLEHAKGERLYPALHLAAFTGMRRGEVAGLRWQDVDLNGAFLTVRETRTSATDLGAGSGTRVIVGEPKSGHGRRVDLDPGTVAVLRAWRKRQAEDRLALGGAWPAHGLVFTMEDGQAPHPDTFSKVFDRLARTAPVSRITLHGLRHTHATLLLKAGEPVNAVAARLGHQDATVTLKYYAHVIPGQGVSTAQRFAGVMAL